MVSNVRNQATVVGGIAVVALLTAIVLFFLANSNLFRDYNLATGTYEGGISPMVALIPAVIAVAAGIAALVLRFTPTNREHQ